MNLNNVKNYSIYLIGLCHDAHLCFHYRPARLTVNAAPSGG